ncbi:MAG: DUF2207 domain-containing protein [Clostridiales bacterium]|nr:DUF2207 domain-containing protein [Clostridiales bacterium]
MKKLVIAVFIFVLCLLPQTASAASNFWIDDYDIQVVVNEDDTYDITETIKVHFTWRSHGIYRTIPLRTSLDRDGQRSTYFAKVRGFEMLSGQKWEDESEYDEFNARIGDEDVYADKDTVYKMSYTYDPQGDHFKGGDEFFYNLIGTSWEAQSIKHVSFDVQFPKAIDMSKVGIKTGDNKMVDFEVVSDQEIKGETSEYVLGGLTVRAVLPEGYYTRQEGTSVIPLLVLTGLMILLAAVGFLLWRKYGRDPQFVETEEFYPPEKLSAPEVGFLAKGEVQGSHVVSALLSLADRGYLKIAEREVPAGFRKNKTKTTYEIIKLREYDDDVIGERAFMDGLFETGDTVDIEDLKNKFYKTVNAIEKDIKNYYRDKLYDPKAATYARILKGGGIAGIILMILATFLGGNGLGFIGPSIIFGPIYIIILAVVAFAVGFGGIAKKINEREHYWGIIGYAICIAVGLAACIVCEIAPGVRFIPFLVGLGMCFVLFLLSALCERKTDWYASVLGKIRGYRNFLKIAEKDKMEMLAEKDPQYFYKNLAYAFALGVTDVYAKRFASLATQPPEWYDSGFASTGGNPVTSTSFLNSMGSMMSSITTSMNSSPSDGGGGGSFSGGGGGGGGGGGSW